MMRAARFHGQVDLRIDEVPIPIARDDEVLVDVEWCGICGSDLHEYQHGPRAVPLEGHPHPLTKEFLPTTMGHEFCGRIRTASPQSKFKVGQPVMVDPRLYCNSCSRCEASHTHCCRSLGFLGFSGGGGGLSETVAIKERMCYALPDDVDLSIAAWIEPLAVATHAIRVSGIESFAEKSILILGGGPIGLAMGLVLRTNGTEKIYISEPTATRQEQNSKVADRVLDPSKEKVGEVCLELTGGEGVDIVFDCAGILPGLEDGMEALRYGGTYINVAVWTSPFDVPQNHFVSKEITIKASFAYDDEAFRQTVEAFSKGAFIGLQQFVTSRIVLEDVVEKGFKELIHNKDHHIKILVSPKKEYFHKT